MPILYLAEKFVFHLCRYLKKLKLMMRTRSHPEASIAEGYILDESLTFCSRYIRGCLTRHNRKARNAEANDVDEVPTMPYLCRKGRQLVGNAIHDLDDTAWLQAHRYVLFNYEHITPYKEYACFL